MFCRQDGQNDRYFLAEVELYIYIQFHVRPFLKELLTPNHRYLLFINAEIEFVKITDPDDSMSIFSSVRNARWLTVDQQNDDYLWDIVDQLLAMFLRKYFDDIENVLRRRGSGWSYNKLLQINVTHLKREPLGLLGFGTRRKPAYNPHLRSAFLRNALDVNVFLPHTCKNDIALSCVPASIALKLVYTKVAGLTHAIKIRAIEETMKNINFKQLLTPTQQTITQANFSRLEKMNLGFNSRLKEEYPFLSAFKGFSLNLFKIVYYPGSQLVSTYRLIPIQLSQHWNSNDFLQVDLLDSDFAFASKTPDKHVLLITHFHRFAQSYLLKTQGVRLKAFSCRACLKPHNNIASHKAHCDNCQDHVKQKSSVLRRVRKNCIIHRPVFRRKDNTTVEISHLKFERKNFFHSLPPLIYGAVDFEASNKAALSPENFPQPPPTSAVLAQKPLGVSIAFTSPYTTTLPPELERVHVQFFDERQNSLDEFYISVLTTLRKCLYLSYVFLKDTLNRDNGPPDLESVPYADRLAYFMATHCSFCGIKYNQVWKNRFIPKKSRHHNHLVKIPNLARKGNKLGQVITLCQTCNVATFSDGFISKTALRIYSQNGSRYDHLFLADMISRVGTRTFKQCDKDGHVIELPILKGQPHLVYKNSNTILSIRMQFNCPNLATCQFHSQDKKAHKSTGHCPYHRKILFMDSCLQITSSLDQMMTDLRKCRLNAHLPNKMIYPKTYRLICEQFNYSEDIFELIVKGKCPQPFEKIDSIAYALDMHEPPPREHFFSRLRGDHIQGMPSVNDEDYARFLDIFSALKCQNYLQLLIVYVATDTSLLLDCLSCYFDYLYGLSGLSPVYFLTNASFALEAVLFNSKDPINKQQLLKIELPSKKIHDLYGKALRGGFSFTNCNFNYFRGLELLETNDCPVSQDRTKNMLYMDVNSLYPSVLSQLHSIGEFTLMNDVKNTTEFHEIATRLQQIDIDFFSAELHEKGHIYLFEVELNFNEKARLAKINCEVSLFPFYEKVSFEQLTGDQKMRGDRLARDPAKEPEKLLSYLKKNLKTTDYAENLLYLAGFHDIKIQRVKTIVRSKAYPIFREWLFTLQQERNKDFSPIMGKTMKSMANSIAGRLHMKCEQFLRAKLCLYNKQLRKWMDHDNFYDLTFINSEGSSIMSFDGMTIVSRNCPAISSRVYSMRQVYLRGKKNVR